VFKFDPQGFYRMPAHFGTPRTDGVPSLAYRDVTTMIVSYVTDRDKLAAYIPEPFELAEEAVVTVAYARNRNIDWLAGRGYNLIGVDAAVKFNGKKDQLTGIYSLVVWENLADAITSGRELSGIPKIYADIPDHTVKDEVWHCSASHFDNRILDITLTGLTAATAEEVAAAQQAREGVDNPMGWRYVPGVGGFGASLSEPTTFPYLNDVTEAYVGEGSIDWNHLTWEQNPTQFHIVNALADLPVLEMRPALVTKGSTNLFIPDRMQRVLR
jgi:acetoacetate decarboxylase